MGSRALKQEIRHLLLTRDAEEGLRQLVRFPARQAVNPLFAFFYDGDTLLKWRAVTAMGVVVAALYDRNPESARVVMRRLIWNLNDESGGIGWGSPEAMGETTARSEALASEYAAILVSYIDPAGNYLEHERLQRGVLWGIGRLANSRPRYMTGAESLLLPFLESPDPFHRGLAAWAARGVGGAAVEAATGGLAGDDSPIEIYLNERLVNRTVGELAAPVGGCVRG